MTYRHNATRYRLNLINDEIRRERVAERFATDNPWGKKVVTEKEAAVIALYVANTLQRLGADMSQAEWSISP